MIVKVMNNLLIWTGRFSQNLPVEIRRLSMNLTMMIGIEEANGAVSIISGTLSHYEFYGTTERTLHRNEAISLNQSSQFLTESTSDSIDLNSILNNLP